MGTPDFSVPALQALIDGPDEVVAVVSQPDRPKGRGKKMAATPTKIVAEASGIPILQPTKIKTEEFGYTGLMNALSLHISFSPKILFSNKNSHFCSSTDPIYFKKTSPSYMLV